MNKSLRYLCLPIIIVIALTSCSKVNGVSKSQLSHNIKNNKQRDIIVFEFEDSALYEEMISTGKTSNQICDDIVIDWMPTDIPLQEELFSLTNEMPIMEEKNITPNEVVKIKGELADQLPPITNNTPLSEIISTIDPWLAASTNYSMQYVEHSWRGAPSILDINNHDINVNNVCYRLSVNFLRQMRENNYYYTVDKIEGHGYVYHIYGKGYKLDFNNNDLVPISKDDSYIYYYGSIYSENIREYKDFSDIKIGSSIYDVINVDSSANITLSYYRYYRDSGCFPYHMPTSSILLLTNGILEFVYMPRNVEYIDYYGEKVVSNRTDDLVVSEINYYPDFEYIPSAMKSQFGIEMEVPIQILPQDYPPAS